MMRVIISTIWVMMFLALCASQTTSFGTSPSIYDALRKNELPMGLLPKGVKEYTLSEDGKFEVSLEQPCDAKFETKMHYDIKISGEMGKGQIRNLTGIEAQDLFLWFPVKGIRVDIPSSGVIYFDVGVVFKQFSLSLFETPRDCVASARPNGHGYASHGFVMKLKRILELPFNHGKDVKEVM